MSLPGPERRARGALVPPALRLAISAALLAGLLAFVPLGEIAGSLRRTHLGLVGIAWMLTLGVRVLAAMRTHRLTARQGISLTVPQLVEISCVSSLYSLALPGSLSGGVVRWHRLSQPDGKRSGALAAMTVDRYTDLVTAAAAGAGFWLLAAEGARPPAAGVLLGGALLALLGAGGVARALATASGGGALVRLRARVARSRLGPLAAAFRLYRDLDARAVGVLVAISLVEHVVGTASFDLLAHALGLPLSFATSGAVRACALLLGTLPLAPAGLGVREVALVFLLAPLGIASADAVALSLLMLSGLLFISVVGAAFEVRAYWLRGLLRR